MSLYDCQTALKTHLLQEYRPPVVHTLDIIAEEMEGESIKQTLKLPAVLIMFRGGDLDIDGSQYEFPLIIATESSSLDKKTSQRNNLQLASDIGDYLLANTIFNSANSNYQIQKRIHAALYALNPRHCIIILHLIIAENKK